MLEVIDSSQGVLSIPTEGLRKTFFGGGGGETRTEAVVAIVKAWKHREAAPRNGIARFAGDISGDDDQAMAAHSCSWCIVIHTACSMQLLSASTHMLPVRSGIMLVEAFTGRLYSELVLVACCVRSEMRGHTVWHIPLPFRDESQQHCDQY